MNTKNFLTLAAVMTAMAMTSVTMTSCTGNEDNAVVLPNIPSDEAPGGAYGEAPHEAPHEAPVGASDSVSSKITIQPGTEDPIAVPVNIDPKDATQWINNPVKDIGLSLDKSSNYNGHWFGFDGYNSYNASNYDYIWIVYSGNTGVFRFGVTYNPQKSDGSYDYDMAKFSTPSGIAYIKLDKTKPNLRNVFTQDDGQEVSMKLEGLWIGTEKGLNWAFGKYGGEVFPVPNPDDSSDQPFISIQ